VLVHREVLVAGVIFILELFKDFLETIDRITWASLSAITFKIFFSGGINSLLILHSILVNTIK
jgi:hypothetical protein